MYIFNGRAKSIQKNQKSLSIYKLQCNTAATGALHCGHNLFPLELAAVQQALQRTKCEHGSSSVSRGAAAQETHRLAATRPSIWEEKINK